MSGNELQNIGLCKKAGKLIWGFDAVISEMKNGGKTLAGVILCGDVSPKTRKEVNFFAEKYGCPVKEITPPMGEVEKVINKRVGVLGVADKGMFGLFG